MSTSKILVFIGGSIILLAVILSFYPATEIENENNRENGPGLVSIDYFWSPSCPYCRRQNEFWETFLDKYPDVSLNRYLVDNPKNLDIFKEKIRDAGASRYGGAVPMTFIGDKFFAGFDSAEGVGRQIEDAVILELNKIQNEEDTTE